MQNNPNIQDDFLAQQKANRAQSSIYLVNGIHLKGRIEAYNDQVILLKSDRGQMIYKHAIATIMS